MTDPDPRAAIMGELARRYDAHEPPPSLRDLAEFLGSARASTGAAAWHIAALRAAGHVRPDAYWLTAAGYAAARSTPVEIAS